MVRVPPGVHRGAPGPGHRGGREPQPARERAVGRMIIGPTGRDTGASGQECWHCLYLQ